MVFGELQGLLDIVDRILERRKVTAAQKTRDKVLIAIYKLGDNGRSGVAPEQLEAEAGFSKLEIHDAITDAKGKNWIVDFSTFDGLAWGLKPEAAYYVEGLLQASEEYE